MRAGRGQAQRPWTPKIRKIPSVEGAAKQQRQKFAKYFMATLSRIPGAARQNSTFRRNIVFSGNERVFMIGIGHHNDKLLTTKACNNVIFNQIVTL